MTNAVKRCGKLGFVALGCLAPLAFADTVSITLTGPGSNGWLGNNPVVYVGPYVGTVNGVASTQIICDDFANETYFNETWTANVYSLSALPAINPLGVPSSQTQYNQVAWLTLQLLNPNNPCAGGAGSNCVGDIQYAIWQVFYGADTGAGSPFGNLSGADLTNAKYWLQQSVSGTLTADQLSSIVIYTPTQVGDPNYATPSCSGHGCAVIPPQEFVAIHTPEPSELALLAFNLLALVGLVVVFRRRLVRG